MPTRSKRYRSTHPDRSIRPRRAISIRHYLNAALTIITAHDLEKKPDRDRTRSAECPSNRSDRLGKKRTYRACRIELEGIAD